MEFPFEPIRDSSGDYWQSVSDCVAAGFSEDQVWSVAVVDEDDHVIFCYGPAHHYVNVIGYVATNERHDGDQYFEETIEMEDLE